ncbi:uncharacterized protein LOC132558573 [Ylistrum balloti]|uniref:uncharacterized protein LOC132558573 n=1 Tax=Ylistrum balloti TaxID=509963 RepID=UPI002905D78E|nr:uncharacterized protein LOC132558573 [Ylistrum balloti]
MCTCLHEPQKKVCCPTALQLLKKHQLPPAVTLLQQNQHLNNTAVALLKNHSFQTAMELLQGPPHKSAVELLKSQHFSTAKQLLNKHDFQTAGKLIKAHDFYTVKELLELNTDQDAEGLLKRHNFTTIRKLQKDSDRLDAKSLLGKPNNDRCLCEQRYWDHSQKVSPHLYQNDLDDNVEPIYATIQPRKAQKSNALFNTTCTVWPSCWKRKQHLHMNERQFNLNDDEDIYEDINTISE